MCLFFGALCKCFWGQMGSTAAGLSSPFRQGSSDSELAGPGLRPSGNPASPWGECLALPSGGEHASGTPALPAAPDRQGPDAHAGCSSAAGSQTASSARHITLADSAISLASDSLNISSNLWKTLLHCKRHGSFGQPGCCVEDRYFRFVSKGGFDNTSLSYYFTPFYPWQVL